MRDLVSNEDVRRQILADHAELRHAIDSVRAVDEPSRLAASAAALFELLVAHLDYEEAALKPLLRSMDGFRRERVRLLQEEHAAQRRALARLGEEIATAPARGLVVTVRAFLDSLEAEMDGEERDLLDGWMLRDDSMTGEFGG
jgi:hypothetical protein